MVAFRGPLNSVKRAVETNGPTAAADAFFGALCPGLWAAIDEPAKNHYRANADMLFAALGMPAYQISEADVAAIQLPVLVVAGAQSHGALHGGARTLASWLPDARFLELECGHVTYAGQPADFARDVAAFAMYCAACADPVRHRTRPLGACLGTAHIPAGDSADR